jgi:cytochrome c biogenesis protein CcdA
MHHFKAALLGVLCLITLGATSCLQQTDTSFAHPVYAAYFYDEGCQPCSGAEYNIEYLKQLFPQLSVQQFNAKQDRELGRWLARRVGRSDFRTPALFIGDQAWIGEVELIPASVQPVVEQYAIAGTANTWGVVAPILWRARLGSALPALNGAIAIACGLIDGLIPALVSALLLLEVVLIAFGRPGSSATPRVPGLRFCIAFAMSLFVVLAALGLAGYAHPIALETLLNGIQQPAILLVILCLLSLAISVIVRRNRVPNRAPVTHTAWGILSACIIGVPAAGLSIACIGPVYSAALIYIDSIFTALPQAIIATLLYSALFVLPLMVILVLALRRFRVNALG